MKKIYRIGTVLLLLLFFTFTYAGCSLFFGSIKPVEEKSTEYKIDDLTVAHSDWKKLSEGRKSNSNPTADLAYQSKTTLAIISLSSLCKRYPPSQLPSSTLHDLTQQLLLGVSDISLREEKMFLVNGTQALETTLKGRIEGQSLMVRTVVLEKNRCVYDLMYFSDPDQFEKNNLVFSDFVNSLKLK